ncbi:MAG: nucleotide exchange factor GrpE [Candidatus Omnitrophica bacterium]|nr:nucleotide exchange factor GrpE [Candidatus Omnitrophota bacterium]
MKKGREKEGREGKKPEAEEGKITLPREEFDKLNARAKKSDEYYDKWLRSQAELENTKKRLDREKSDFIKFANEDLIVRLLPIADNFDRALLSVRHTKESDAVLEGIKMVQKELSTLFNDYGAEKVKSVGEKFNPHIHEAIAVVESDEYPEDTVVEEIQTGYTLKGRLIRPSIVKVSKRREEDKDAGGLKNG